MEMSGALDQPYPSFSLVMSQLALSARSQANQAVHSGRYHFARYHSYSSSRLLTWQGRDEPSPVLILLRRRVQELNETLNRTSLITAMTVSNCMVYCWFETPLFFLM